MLFFKALSLAILGTGIPVLAAPLNAAPTDLDVKFSALSKAIQDATSPQAVQDICSGIPFEERRRHRECEEDKRDGDVWGECLELHRTGGHDQRCGDYSNQSGGYQGGGYGGYQGGYPGGPPGGPQGGYGGWKA